MIKSNQSCSRNTFDWRIN